MNGAINTSTLTCSTCHGNKTLVASGLQDPNVAAAPTGTGAPDTYGNTAIATANGVGVHAAHVLGTRSKPVLCNACHTVPGTQIHKTGVATAGTVTLANLSTFGGIANATYAGAGGTCSNVYCHGNFSGGAGAIATPTWKTAGALSCTSCHGNPPALSATTHHPANTACASCHGTGYTATTVVAATHVDGTVNLSRTGCTLCHGDLTQTAVAATSGASAPGFNASSADTTGATAATAAAVGAHGKHLTGTSLRSVAISCGDCHLVPGSGDVAHATGAGTGGARATVAFSGLATTGGITTAAYAGSTTGTGGTAAGNCSNTYCHGNFKNGATTATLSWLGGAAAVACGSCHGLPPGGTHPANANCSSCHTGYTATTVNTAVHLNGAIDVVNLTCTSCHGSAARVSVAGADLNQAAAPPVDTSGATTGVARRHARRARQPGRRRRGLQAGRLHRVPHQQRRQQQSLERRRERDLRRRHGREPGQLRPHLRPGQRHDHADHLRHLLPRLVAQRDDDPRLASPPGPGTAPLPTAAAATSRLPPPPTTTTPRRSRPARSATAAPSTRPASSTSPAACT